MNAQQQLHALEEIAEQLSVKVCYEPMAGLVQGVGGLCKVRGEYRVIIDRRLRTPERLNILADALRRFDVSAFALTDGVRQLLGKPSVAEAPS